MEFNQKELEYLLECLNFHYSENEYIQEEIIDINSQLCKRINEQLVLHSISITFSFYFILLINTNTY